MQLVTWREGETICDTFEVGRFAQQTVTIQPDALFELEDSGLAAESNRVTFGCVATSGKQLLVG
jgi:hypothetical protein